MRYIIQATLLGLAILSLLASLCLFYVMGVSVKSDIDKLNRIRREMPAPPEPLMPSTLTPSPSAPEQPRDTEARDHRFPEVLIAGLGNFVIAAMFAAPVGLLGFSVLCWIGFCLTGMYLGGPVIKRRAAPTPATTAYADRLHDVRD